MDKKEKKVEKSKGRARTVQQRAKAWDELNKRILSKKAREEALERERENGIEEDDEVEIQDDNKIEDTSAPETVGVEAVAQSIPLPDPTEAEDEIL
jgi:Alb1